MDAFKHHTSCPRCGSSDARAVYVSGSSYCFSCRYLFPSKISPYVQEHQDTPRFHNLALPDDCGFDYSPLCLQWVGKYGLSTNELIEQRVLWSPSRQQLIFTWYDESDHILLWQARNFKEGAKKYFTRGVPDECLPIYYHRGRQGIVEEINRRRLVIVEDCVSAIKIARMSDSMPCLGSDINRGKLSRLRAYYGPSWGIVVWLDSNMYHKAQKIAQRLCFLGMNARAVYTELDPKCYDDDEISKIILPHIHNTHTC